MAFHRITTTCTAFFALATPSLADITAAEVIADWYETARKMRQELTVSATEQDGDVITLRDYSLTQSFPDGELTVLADWLRFRDLGDGTVEITNTPEMTMQIALTSDYADDEVFEIDINSPGAMLVSGTAQEMTYSSGPDDILLRIDLTRFDDSIETGEFTLLLSDTDFSFVQTIMPDDYLGIDGRFSVGAIEMTVEGSDVDRPETIRMTALINNLDTVFDLITAPMPESGVQSPGDNIGTVEISVGSAEVGFQSEGSLDGDFSAEIRLDSAFSKSVTSFDSIVFHQLVREFNVIATMPGDMLDQISYGFDLIESTGTLPIGARGKLQDFAFALTLNGMTVGDAAWALFDPEQTVPRDPANFALDISGTVKMFIDIFDPAAKFDSFSQTGQPYVEFGEINLNTFSLDLAGARLAGFGALSFPEDGEYGPYHLPDPVGKLTLSAQGVQQLIVTLGALPTVPAELTFGAMSMIGMFSKPTGEVDSYETVIEFDAGYGITINGMKIQ